MCSIEEAWAGQNFAGKPVSSQGDIHNAYVSLPDDITTRNNQFSLTNTKEPQSRDLTRGLNSKYSRMPRVPSNMHNYNDTNINISSQLPKSNNNYYNGIEPRPSYMEIYDKTDPLPSQSKDTFTNIDNAYNVSDTVNNFMERGTNSLLLEDTDYERELINNKFSNKNDFTNINTKQQNKYNSADRTASLDTEIGIHQTDAKLQMLLYKILTKLDTIETELQHRPSRNMHDIILYILIGMLLSFILYSIFSKQTRNVIK